MIYDWKLHHDPKNDDWAIEGKCDSSYIGCEIPRDVDAVSIRDVIVHLERQRANAYLMGQRRPMMHYIMCGVEFLKDKLCQPPKTS